MISLSFITSFTYAYYAAFLDYMDDDEKNMLTQQEFLFIPLFTIDIIVNFLTEYHYPMSSDIETDPIKISIIYLKGRFIWDILSVVPFRKIYPDMAEK